MSFRKRAFCTAVSAFLMSVSASVLRANVAPVPGGTASFSETLPFSTNLTGFSQYHGVLPLAAIDFTFVTNLTGTATVESGPGNPTQTASLDFSSALSVSNPSDTIVLVTARPTASTPVVIPGDGVPIMESVSGTSITASAALTNSALFAPFEGTGTFSLPVSGEIEVGFTPALIPPFSVPEATGSVKGTLQLSYVPVPEPSTARAVLLGGLVLAATCLLRRRRNVRSAAADCPPSIVSL